MNKITVTTREQLSELYQDCALTFVGVICNDTNLNELVDWMKQYTSFLREDVYIVSGYLMNVTYGLSGADAYEDDFPIVCFKVDDMVDPFKLIIPRYQRGGRWFNDIVDNNVLREAEEKARLTSQEAASR